MDAKVEELLKKEVIITDATFRTIVMSKLMNLESSVHTLLRTNGLILDLLQANNQSLQGGVDVFPWAKAIDSAELESTKAIYSFQKDLLNDINLDLFKTVEELQKRD